jgi:hypothetical protein
MFDVESNVFDDDALKCPGRMPASPASGRTQAVANPAGNTVTTATVCGNQVNTGLNALNKAMVTGNEPIR